MKKIILLLIIIVCTFQLHAQEYTILIPSKIINQSSQSGCDPSDLIEVASEFLKLHASIACVQKINPKLDSCIKVEMRKIKTEKQYILAVDYIDCKFISLFPDEGSELFKSPKWTIYHITLYPDITLHPNFPSSTIIKKDENSASKRPLLATYLDDNGKWIAMGPYTHSDSYPTEKQSLDELFYGETGQLTLLCKRGKYNIYVINGKTNNIRVDVRYALKMLGVNDIPE